MGWIPHGLQTMTMTAEAAHMNSNSPAASDSERLVDQLANRIGGLGVELADVAGSVQEVAQRVSGQSERFGHLQKTAKTMVAANHDIAGASKAVQSATTAAVDEITQSRSAVETAVSHIAELIEAVGRIESRLGAVSSALAQVAKVSDLDRGDRQADQPARAQRHHRGRARGRCGPRLCGRRQRGQEPRGSDAAGDATDRRHRARARRPGRQPHRRKRRGLGARPERRRGRRPDPEHHRPRPGRLCQGRARDRRRHQSRDIEPRPLRRGDLRARQPRQGRRSLLLGAQARRRARRQAARSLRGPDRDDCRLRRGDLGRAADPHRGRDRKAHLADLRGGDRARRDHA